MVMGWVLAQVTSQGLWLGSQCLTGGRMNRIYSSVSRGKGSIYSCKHALHSFQFYVTINRTSTACVSEGEARHSDTGSLFLAAGRVNCGCVQRMARRKPITHSDKPYEEWEIPHNWKAGTWPSKLSGVGLRVTYSLYTLPGPRIDDLVMINATKHTNLDAERLEGLEKTSSLRFLHFEKPPHLSTSVAGLIISKSIPSLPNRLALILPGDLVRGKPHRL